VYLYYYRAKNLINNMLVCWKYYPVNQRISNITEYCSAISLEIHSVICPDDRFQ
jgi:hypothetical protein